MLLSAEASRNSDRCTACFDVNGPRGMKNGDRGNLERKERVRGRRTFFSIVRASINGSVGIGRSSLRIECGGDCSNLKV